jgi:carbamoyl-phosphate synthase large subunit
VVKMPSLSNTALQICDKIGLRYNINIQFKEDINKVPKIIEINPRVSGTIVACIKAGINLPHLAIKKFLGKSISNKELEYKTGTLYRYWGGLWHE